MATIIDALYELGDGPKQEVRFYWDGTLKKWDFGADMDNAVLGTWDVSVRPSGLQLEVAMGTLRARYEDAGVYAHLESVPQFDRAGHGSKIHGESGHLSCALFAGLKQRFLDKPRTGLPMRATHSD